MVRNWIAGLFGIPITIESEDGKRTGMITVKFNFYKREDVERIMGCVISAVSGLPIYRYMTIDLRHPNKRLVPVSDGAVIGRVRIGDMTHNIRITGVGYG